MTARFIAFFNNKGGIGTTSLVYHLAWIMARSGLEVVAADLDPQANLTSNFLDEDAVEALWPPNDGKGAGKTIFGSLQPLIRGVGDIGPVPPVPIIDGLTLLPGDLSLSNFEADLSSQWPECLDGKERAFRVISAFWRILTAAASARDADVVLIDVGSNLGAINRAALIAADNVVIPLVPDLFSIQGLRNLGPTLRTWRREWVDRGARNPDPALALPKGDMDPACYVLLRHGIRLWQPVHAYQRWMQRIPGVYRESVLGVDAAAPDIDDDPECLAQLKHYRSLMPLSQEAHKPVFELKPADGAFGGHQAAVLAARTDFVRLASKILMRTGVPLPGPLRDEP